MNMESTCRVSARGLSLLIGSILVITLAACTGNGPVVPIPVVPTLVVPFPSVTDTLLATQPALSTPTPSCLNGLTFLSDLTIPDDSPVTPGSRLDKQWLVQNSGSCNWDGRYRLGLLNGVALGASPEQALYPARAGMQARIQIFFAAPPDAGTYTSEWQAFDEGGNPFGDAFYIKVIVQP